MNILEVPLLTTVDQDGRNAGQRTLPGILAALVRDEIGDTPALQPHQRHVWHAFLVQVAALASVKEGHTDLPDAEDAWHTRLLGLTPDQPDGAAWTLVMPPTQPAFLQPPVPGGDLSTFKLVETPDALDMLVTAKNHDVKAARLAEARPEHWIYALISLQTQEGFLGAGNYGIARMNGGFASRSGFGIDPGSPGTRFVRDVSRLVGARSEILRDYAGYPADGGIGLVWLQPWDGTGALLPSQLDPYYIEICRRVRLTVGAHGRLAARTAGSKGPRIEAKALKGRTGDPWTPLVPDKDGYKALTLDASGFTYKRLVPLLFPRATDPDAAHQALLQVPDASDPDDGLSIVARALVRGQGKTEGFHERRIPVSKVLKRRLLMAAGQKSDPAAACAHERVRDAGEFARRVVYPAAMAVATGAPRTEAGQRARDDDSAKKRAGIVMRRFDDRVDETFFGALDAELAVLDDADAARRQRAAWFQELGRIGREVLDRNLDAAPGTGGIAYWRMRVRAIDLYERCRRRYLEERVPADLPTELGVVHRPPVDPVVQDERPIP